MGCSGYEQMAMEADKAAYNQKVKFLYYKVMAALTDSRLTDAPYETEDGINEEDPAVDLCYVMKILTKKQTERLLNDLLEPEVSGKLAEWWSEHSKIDKAREKEEKRIAALRKSGLKKLTKAEREALGV
jgi:hypothetical protein